MWMLKTQLLGFKSRGSLGSLTNRVCNGGITIEQTSHHCCKDSVRSCK